MNKLLTAGTTLSVLEKLRHTASDFGARETALIESRDRDLAAVQRTFSAQMANFRKEAETLAAISQKTLDDERDRIESRFEARRIRIEQALEKKNKALHEAAEDARSQQQYENQKVLLQAQRVHDTDALAMEQTWKSYVAKLSVEIQRLERIQHLAWKMFRGYKTFRNLLQSEVKTTAQEANSDDEYVMLQTLRSQLAVLESQLRLSVPSALAKFFSIVPIWGVLLFVLVLGVGVAFFVPPVPFLTQSFGLGDDYPFQIIGMTAALLGFVVLVYGVGYLLARGRVRSLLEQYALSTHVISCCQQESDQSRKQGLASIEQTLREIETSLNDAWQSADAAASKQLEKQLSQLQRRKERLVSLHQRMEKEALHRLTSADAQGSLHGGDRTVRSLETIETERQSKESEVRDRFKRDVDALFAQWNKQVPAWVALLEGSGHAAAEMVTNFETAVSGHWESPVHGDSSGGFAELVLDLRQFIPSAPVDARMTLTESLRVPLAFKLPEGESILFESNGAAPEEIVDALNGMALRLLMSSPVGRMQFTLIDPVGLGKNFAGLMHLADHDEHLIHRRIWTQSNQIEQCLRDLTDHMEKVTQMYLRNEYPTLEEYNRVAGNIAEKYQVLVISDFPVEFSETALRRLQSIVVSGARCGVFVWLHRDQRHALPDDSMLDDLHNHCVWMRAQDEGCRPGSVQWTGCDWHWYPNPEPQKAIAMIHQIGRASVDSNRVEVPFSQIAPRPEEIWSLNTGSVLRVPIGRTGASKWQYLTLGKGTQQHALIAGKTGSGKSTLFHVMVSNLALWCSPDQVEFYLIDFKKGVEFKCYATHRLPHARVIAIESDREFGLSVLERIDQELRRRGDLFRLKGVQDLSGYLKATEGETLPRTLLMIDEFQEFFVEDDRVAQNAAVLLDRIVRQGRAFGIHVILGSQTLGGAYTLARTTFAQMAVRIALQCDEADAYLIMDESNAAPRLLSRPGEGVYNDSNGAVEGNSPFQTVWLTDAERETYLHQVAKLSMERSMKQRELVVFEGNVPADIADNDELAAAVSVEPDNIPDTPRAWLGAPNAIKGPTCATFGLQSGSHVLILGQNDEMAFSMVISSLISLAAQYPKGQAEFVVLDALPDRSTHREMLDQVVAMVPHPVRTLRKNSLEDIMAYVDTRMDQPASEGRDPNAAIFVMVIGLQLFKKLKPEDEFNFGSTDDQEGQKPGDVFLRILLEGSSLGIRSMVTVDSYSSAQRFLNRKALSEFEMRILFQMSGNDSAALIDNTKASQLGLHRALFYNERRGHLETFRPYALPDSSTISALRESFEKRIPRKRDSFELQPE